MSLRGRLRYFDSDYLMISFSDCPIFCSSNSDISIATQEPELAISDAHATVATVIISIVDIAFEYIEKSLLTNNIKNY